MISTKNAVDNIPPNYCFKPGDDIKYMVSVNCSVHNHYTDYTGIILETTDDNAFYTIKRTHVGRIFIGDNNDVDTKIPYFLTCPVDKNLYFENLIKEGTVVSFRKGVHEKFHRGIVTKVHYFFNGRSNGFLDIIDMNKETTYGVPLINYMFDIDFYNEAIKQYQNRNIDNIKYDRTDFFKEIIENVIDFSVEKFKQDLMDNDNIPFEYVLSKGPFDPIPPKYDCLIRSLTYDLHYDTSMFPDLNYDTYRDAIVKKLGRRYYLLSLSEDDREKWPSGCYHADDYIVKKPVPCELLDEITERGFLPTKHVGIGGALFRESMNNFYLNNN